MRKIDIYFLIALICSLALFFGLFFGLNYSEIVVYDTFKPSACKITNSEIETRYCCEKQCTDCSTTDSSSPMCDTLISLTEQNFSPSQCATNASMCAVPAECNNGYECCE